MRLEFGYGAGVQRVDVPDKNLLGVLEGNPVAFELTGEEAVRRALDEPIGTRRLREIARPHERIAVVTSDVTRPMPTRQVMPALLDELHAAGVGDEDVTLVFALGSHRSHTREEMVRIAGDLPIALVDSDPEDCVHLGDTSRGTPVDITRVVAQADRRILLGNIEYHYFAGYSGGAKALMPGVSTRAAIQKNHGLMVLPGAEAGNLEDNPLRRDIEEAGNIAGVDFILNVVLDEHKHIVRAVAGDVTQAHRAGCAFLDHMYLKPIARRADIVLVSQGGYPKDLNLYQVQKALDNAKHAVKAGGVVILIGSCPEGLGERTFEQWMLSAPTAHSMIERIEREFVLGGHKAAAIAMVLEEASVYLVSELDAEIVRQMFLKPFQSAQSALDAALDKLGSHATVLAMPYGGSTLPRAKS